MDGVGRDAGESAGRISQDQGASRRGWADSRTMAHWTNSHHGNDKRLTHRTVASREMGIDIERK